MNIQQLKYLTAIVDHRFNLTEAAAAIYTSQPGISKQIRLLEEELGATLFVRQGKRLTGLTPAGQSVIEHARRVMLEIDNMKRIGAEHQSGAVGHLVIATTHTQARYVLPKILPEFLARWPKVKLQLHQGNPTTVADQVAKGLADVGIATESLENAPGIISLPCYSWNRCVLVPTGHPLSTVKILSLDDLAAYPIVTYDDAFTGRSLINQTFAARGLTPNIVLTALDSDVIKTYVRMGLGIGLVARMAFDAAEDRDFVMLDCTAFFPASTTRIALKRGVKPRGYCYDFIQLFAPQLHREVVDAALLGLEKSYEL